MKNSRKKEVLLKKIFLTLFVFLSIYANKFIRYEFDNYMINGVLIIIFSVVFMHILDNDKFYIDTGITTDDLDKSDTLNREKYKIFNKQHRIIATYNMMISFGVIISFVTSVVMIAMHFFK